jgi:sugar phosphate isomerase/epimerase
MEGSYESIFSRISEAGYEGIESWLPGAEDRPLFQNLLRKYNLKFIALIGTSRDGDAVRSFEVQLTEAAAMNPVLIISHSASDSMPFPEQIDFFSKAVEIEKRIGIPVGHETHRARAMFTPWNTASLLKEIPDLKITADFSHWCCVCESLLEDQRDNVALAIERTLHVHGRVGYAEGPQVSHPGAPEWKTELDTHIGWWLEIAAARKSKGYEQMTFTAEFGPPTYMHTLPFSNVPVANLWDICLWMTEYFRAKVRDHLNLA